MSMSTEGGGNQLMVDVITPQTWIRQYRPKSRRVALSHRRRITIIKAKRHKAINSQELIFQKLLESQFLTRRSSSIGSQFDPFQSFPVSAPAVSHMAQYCMSSFSSPPTSSPCFTPAKIPLGQFFRYGALNMVGPLPLTVTRILT